jgi:hypothetical protein
MLADTVAVIAHAAADQAGASAAVADDQPLVGVPAPEPVPAPTVTDAAVAGTVRARAFAHGTVDNFVPWPST